MVHEALSIRPRNAVKLEAVGRLLRRGRARLTGPQGESVIIPEPLYALLKFAVRSLTQGRSLVLIPEKTQLTTKMAAELLGVSRPFLIRLLDAGEMPFSLVGSHRRINRSDVISYAKRKSKRKAALDKMARHARQAGLYDKAAGIPKGGRPLRCSHSSPGYPDVQIGTRRNIRRLPL